MVLGDEKGPLGTPKDSGIAYNDYQNSSEIERSVNEIVLTLIKTSNSKKYSINNIVYFLNDRLEE